MMGKLRKGYVAKGHVPGHPQQAVCLQTSPSKTTDSKAASSLQPRDLRQSSDHLGPGSLLCRKSHRRPSHVGVLVKSVCRKVLYFVLHQAGEAGWCSGKNRAAGSTKRLQDFKRNSDRVAPHLNTGLLRLNWASQVAQWQKKSTCQSRSFRRCGFDPWVKKIPWSWKQQPTPVFLPGKFHGQRSLAGYSPWSHQKELDTT